MSLKRRVVWLPYDMDTAIGINNEGDLVFGYELEDIDQTETGADVFNGQESVIWKNLRDAFFPELRTMYQALRSSGALSYEKVEKMFEEHQEKWPEAVFNEDSMFKYIDPLLENGTGTYLAMLQGSKAEQRKWWLYNRFRYLDSKYNAGNAASDVIQLRGYAVSNITITPYADIYASVKFGSYLQQARAKRGRSYTIPCPLENVNDTEIYIYSASQLASVGDLSGFKAGLADFSMATRLQSVKLGDADPEYENQNLGAGSNTLTFGNNVLLRLVDVRNCTSLGLGTQKTVDLSSCTNVEEVYFDGTKIQGLSLPNGGVLKKLHLPGTITNLTILNQRQLTEFVCPDLGSISTIRLENNAAAVNTRTILGAIPQGSRVRLIGFTWEAEDAEEIEDLLDRLDSMLGLDEYGNNVTKAQVSGIIHTGALTGAQIANYNERYPYLRVTADHVTSYLSYASYDGSSILKVVTCLDGVPQEAAPSGPSRTSTAQYDFSFIGWSKTQNSETVDSDASDNVTADRTIYAVYEKTLRTYTVTWKNADNTTLEIDLNVPYGTTPTYDSAVPSYDGQTSAGWSPEVGAITGDTTYTAVYLPTYEVTFKRASDDGGGTLATITVVEGRIPVYSGATPTTTRGDNTKFQFNGWKPALGPIYEDTTYTAVFKDLRALTIQYLNREITEFESETLTKFGAYGFAGASSLVSAKAPATTVASYAFNGCSNLTTVELNGASPVTISAYAFQGCSKLDSLIIRSTTMSVLSGTNVLGGTLISAGIGAVYVPAELVDTYKANAKWSEYFIASIDQYPLSDYSTITDSWAEIFAAEDNGTYSTRYSVGDTKSLEMNGEKVYMQIVAMDKDVLADESGNAKITWLMKNALNTDRRMNTSSTAANGWAATDLRTYLRETILPTIDTGVRSQIKEVTKTYYDYTTRSTLSIADTLWIPSGVEISGNSSSNTYTDFFNSNARRIKYKSGTANIWWLRSAYNASSFKSVKADGSLDYDSASAWRGVVIGFCT